MAQENEIIEEGAVSTENAGSGDEQLSSNPEDYDTDSSDISPEALKELLGESEEQPKTDSKKPLDHDKSMLGSTDELDEIQQLLNEENKDGDESTDDSSNAKEGESSEETSKVEIDGKSYDVPAELKNSIMRHSDYTQKTQDVADQRKGLEDSQKSLETERETFRTEQQSFTQQNEKALSEHEAFSYATDLIKQSDPDFYEEMQEKIQESLRHYSNPVMDRMSKELTELRSKVTASEDSQTIGKFYTEFGVEQANVIPKMEKLGIKVNQEQVKQFWGKGMTVKQALNALYGDNIKKMSSSKAKVQAAKNIAARGKKTALGGAARTPSTGKKTYSSYSDITNSLLR